MSAISARLPAFSGLLCCLVLVGANVAPAEDAPSYLLRYQFHRGEIVGYQVDHNSEVFVQQQLAEQHIQHGSLTNKRYTVHDVDEAGNATLDLQIDRVQMTASVDGGASISYDTASGESPPTAFGGIDATVGKPHIRVEVSPRGELLSLNWLIATNQKSKPTIEDAAALDIMVLLPEDPIRVGETWKEQFEAQINATAVLKKSVRIQREYTLESVEGGQAKISLKTVVLTPLHDPGQEYQLVSKTPRGDVTFDLARGIVTSRTHNVDKVVVGFSGDDSKVHTQIAHSEKLAPVAVALETDTTDETATK